MKKSLFYTSSYISDKLFACQASQFFNKSISMLEFIEMQPKERLQHVLFYASLKKSFAQLIDALGTCDESTLYGALHMLGQSLFPFEQLRSRESLTLVDNHCRATTLSSSSKKYHQSLTFVIQEIYLEMQEERMISKYRDQFLRNPSRATLIEQLYNEEHLSYSMANKIAQKIPFYAKNSTISATKDLEHHILSLYIHHHPTLQDESFVIYEGKDDSVHITHESWYNIKHTNLDMQLKEAHL
jgi:hypothetical protein